MHLHFLWLLASLYLQVRREGFYNKDISVRISGKQYKP